VTAVTREDSKSKVPEGVKVARINYDDEKTIVSALEGQQVLIITLDATAPPEIHSKLVQAAAKAGVPLVMPNSWGGDFTNKKLAEENLYGVGCIQRAAEIVNTGVSSYTNMVCGHWYEWSLALGEHFYGIDIRNKKATFFDDGKTRVDTSTWNLCGKAIAAFVSLKELPDDENDKSPSISQWKNNQLVISSFLVSQRDMLDSVHRVMGTTDKDWEISYEPSGERYQNGLAELKAGERTGFAKAMYTRYFYPNGDGNYGAKLGLQNSLLGLGKEDLDEATKRTVEMVESGWNPFGQ
jgi:hypothetical protein